MPPAEGAPAAVSQQRMLVRGLELARLSFFRLRLGHHLRLERVRLTLAALTRLRLMREPDPGQRHGEQDVLVVRALLDLGLAQAIGGVLAAAFGIDHRMSPFSTPRPGAYWRSRLWPRSDRNAAKFLVPTPAAIAARKRIAKAIRRIDSSKR